MGIIMAIQNNSRISDFGTILMVGSSGFSTRKLTGIGLFFHLFLLACMVIFGVALLMYYQSPMGLALAAAIGLGVTLIIKNLEKLKKHKESLEFMNALFSSALGAGWKFCCIVKSTGELVFYNRSFQTVFPAYLEQTNRTLEGWMRSCSLEQYDCDIIKNFIQTSTAGTVNISLKDAGSDVVEPVVFHIEPIERPTGFFLIRGK